MPIIPIRNFTRYNTDDILAIQAVVEEYITACGSPLRAADRVDNIEFHDFAPADANDKIKKWNGRGYDVTTVRKYVSRMSYARPERIPLLVPKLLHENVLEALASASDIEYAPEKMVEMIATEMVKRYNFDAWRYRNSSGEVELKPQGLTLRIEKKVQTKKPDSLRDREKARRALSSAQQSGYELRAALHSFSRYYKGIEQANKHFATPEGAALQHKAADAYVVLTEMLKFHDLQVTETLKDKRAKLAEEV